MRSSPDLQVTHREVIIDPNNGTRARLPLCNPNPNRVKEERKSGRGGGCHWNPVTTATARGKRTDPFGSEKR